MLFFSLHYIYIIVSLLALNSNLLPQSPSYDSSFPFLFLIYVTLQSAPHFHNIFPCRPLIHFLQYWYLLFHSFSMSVSSCTVIVHMCIDVNVTVILYTRVRLCAWLRVWRSMLFKYMLIVMPGILGVIMLCVLNRVGGGCVLWWSWGPHLFDLKCISRCVPNFQLLEGVQCKPWSQQSVVVFSALNRKLSSQTI